MNNFITSKIGNDLKIGDGIVMNMDQVFLVTGTDPFNKTIQICYLKNNKFKAYSAKLCSHIYSMGYLTDQRFQLVKEDIILEQDTPSNIKIPKLVFAKDSGRPFLMAKNIKEGNTLYNMIRTEDPEGSFVSPESLIYNYELAPIRTKIRLKSIYVQTTIT